MFPCANNEWQQLFKAVWKITMRLLKLHKCVWVRNVAHASAGVAGRTQMILFFCAFLGSGEVTVHTFDSDIQSTPWQGWSLQWQCYRWVWANTQGRRSRWGRLQSSEVKGKKVVSKCSTKQKAKKKEKKTHTCNILLQPCNSAWNPRM